MTEILTPDSAAVPGAVTMANATVSRLHPAGSFDIGDHPLPARGDEVWRFTPFNHLGDLMDPDGFAPGPGYADKRDGSSPRTNGTVPVRGQKEPTQSPSAAPAFRRLARGEAPRGVALVPVDRPAAIAAAADQAWYLPLETSLTEPVRLEVRGGGAQPTADHLVIEAKPGVTATVLIHHCGTARHIGNVEILVGNRAELTVVSIQDWDPGSVHLGQHEALVSPDARYRHVAVSLGGDIVRLASNVKYAGAGGRAELFGVYLADAGRHVEHRLFVDHNQPGGVSNVDYRGAIQDNGSRSVWVGDVLIRAAATGIETYESNRNLVLTDGCRANAVPNLEIETGEITGAGHSATTGRFDDEQLFYLRSRGIPEAEARRLVVRGFFAAILDRIGIPDVEQALMGRIDAVLESDKEN